jgi:hypothetical protein
MALGRRGSYFFFAAVFFVFEFFEGALAFFLFLLWELLPLAMFNSFL